MSNRQSDLIRIFYFIDRFPVEQDEKHFSELRIAAYVDEYGFDDIYEIVNKDVACAIRLLSLSGRIKNISESDRVRLLAFGLNSTNLKIREAAVNMVESFKTPKLVEILSRHNDSSASLQKQIARLTNP